MGKLIEKAASAEARTVARPKQESETLRKRASRLSADWFIANSCLLGHFYSVMHEPSRWQRPSFLQHPSLPLDNSMLSLLFMAC